MEPAPVELNEPTSLVSNPAPPPLGIRAVLSRDDSDGETSVLSDTVPSNEIESKGFSSSTSSFGSDSDKEEEEEVGFVRGSVALGDGERGGVLEKPLLETPRVQVPIAKITADEDEDDDDELVIGEEEERFDVNNVTPKVRASGDEELEFEEEEEGFQTASEEAKADDLLEDYGLDEEDVVDESMSEATLVKSEVGDENGVKFTSDADAIVDSVGVNLSEDGDVVAEMVESNDSEVQEIETSAVEEPASGDLEAVGLNDVNDTYEDADDTEVSETKEVETFVDEESATFNAVDTVSHDLKVVAGVDGEAEGVQDLEARLPEPFASKMPDLAKSGIGEIDGAKFTSQGDSVVDKINVDGVEAIRTGVAVVGEHDASLMGLEAEENGSAVDKSVKTEMGSSRHDTDRLDAVADQEEISGSVDHLVGVNTVAKPETIFEGSVSNADLYGSTDEGKDDHKPEADGIGEIDGAKFTSQEDSVVDKISVDGVEAIRTGVSVVGEHDALMDLEAEENGSAVDKSVKTEMGSSRHDTNHLDAVADQEEISGSVDHLVGVNTVADEGKDDRKPEADGIGETDGAKLTSQEDSVVDKINVDILEATRSGAAAVGEHDALKGLEAEEKGSAVDKSVKTEMGSSRHDTDLVDSVNTVAEPGAIFEGPVINADGDLGRDKEKLQEDHTVDDTYQTNDIGLDNSHLKESTDEGKDDHKPEVDEESLEGSTDGETDGLIFGGSATARQFMQEMEQASEQIDGQMVTDSEEEEADSDNEQDGNELFDSTAFAALLKAATNASIDSSNLTVTSQDGTRLFSVDRPAGLGPSFRPVRPNYPSVFTSPGATAVSEEKLTEEERNKLEKLQQLRVKFIRLIYRLGHSVEDSVAAQVLYRLALVAGRPSVPSFSLEVAKQTALKLEEEGRDDLNISLNILVLGKSGVGKSATINSIFGEEKVRINAFEPGTTVVNEITGFVSGVNIRVIDTPGLRSSALEQGFNHKVLASVKKLTNKFQPDIVLYVDRLDSQTKDLNDLPMLRTITSSLGSSIWRNAIVALTHAACAPPDGPSGSPLSYEVFVAQRSHIVQQYIGQAVGDFRLMNSGLMNPISLVENHIACRENREGQKVLPNGQAWKPQLMLLCFSTKILSEASSASKAHEDQRKLFGFRVRSLPLPYLLSSLLQPRAYPKLTSDQGGDDAEEEDEYSDLDVDEEEEDEYDQLPPFKPLRKAQIARLSKDQKKAYFEEYDYRVKLLQRRQWKEEVKRTRGMKNKEGEEEYDEEENEASAAAVPVPLPDMVLPQTFDGDNPAYRYRFLEPTSRFLARPVLDTHGWDHDCGYDGVNIEQSLGIAGRFPAAVTVQVTKDKKDFSLHLDSSVAAKHGEHGSSLVGFDIQNIGKQMGYVIRGETKYKKLKKNKVAAGASVTFLGENVATGLKVEDRISVGKRLVFVGSTGTVRSDKDAAYGANLEIRFRDSDHPIGQDQSSLLLSLMKWKGDLALGANCQSQVSIGRNSKMAFRVALNNKLSGQISVRTSSSDHLQLALAGLVPIAVSVFRSFRPPVREDYAIY